MMTNTAKSWECCPTLSVFIIIGIISKAPVQGVFPCFDREVQKLGWMILLFCLRQPYAYLYGTHERTGKERSKRPQRFQFHY